jgi:hypothetical protein
MNEEQLSFFNTPGLTGDSLREQRARKASQNAEILDLFKREDPDGLTPWGVHRLLDGHMSIVSIRRAITTLTDQGELEKTDEQRRESEGILNYVWRLAHG